MNERRLNNMIEAKQEWERQLRLITLTGVPGRKVTKTQCEAAIMLLADSITKEILS